MKFRHLIFPVLISILFYFSVWNINSNSLNYSHFVANFRGLLSMAETKSRVLLPKDVQPIKYQLTLTPKFEDFTFEGKELVEVEVKTATDKIVIHANDIKVS